MIEFKDCICICYCYLNFIRYTKNVKYEYYVDIDGDYVVKRGEVRNAISWYSFNKNFMDLKVYRDEKINELI